MKNEKEKGRFDDFAVEVITPITQKVFEVAFDCIAQHGPDSDEPTLVPIGVKEGVLETLDEIIEHCEGQAGHFDSASLIGFALGRDGMKPGRQYRSMAAITRALRDLIAAKDDQIKEEIAGIQKHTEQEHMADMLGF